MAIYADKNRAGELTGKFRVELQSKGQRYRGTFSSIKDAQDNEDLWRKGITQPTPPLKTRGFDPRGNPKTLGELYAKAAPILWSGTTTEEQALARCKASVDLIGSDRPLSTLSTLHLDGLVVNLAEDKSPATINRYLSALHKLLDWGQARKYLSSVPQFPWNREEEGRIRWLSEAEEDGLLKALGASPVALVVKIAIATGMRRNELLDLNMKDVEPNWVRLWVTKNKTPRSIPITPETHTLLMKLFKVGMPTLHQLRYAWEKAAGAIGLGEDPLFVFHACRHTCATRLVRANVNPVIIQRWLGHKRLETTLRYTHINDEMLTDALGKLNHPDHILRQSPANPR